MSSSPQLTIEDIKKRSGRENLSEIRQLDLSGLGLTCIPDELLQELPNLTELNMSKNKLTDIKSEKAFPKLKVLSVANNQLSNVEGLTAFSNLISLDVTSNPTLEDISLMRNAVDRLDSTMTQKITDFWNEQFNTKYNQLDEDKRTELKNEFIEKLKSEVTCGPAMLKNYREYKLTILGNLHFKKIKAEEKTSEEPPYKKQRTRAGMLNT
ncbi:Leucine-rich repeat and WD repeat-containing protein 1 [Stylophora pistillata]|uniref:Leucine-rich repeat and WD repeat-containing protein 1 n=1 Tax=Stylophora pistillata TaxID=50429 RepID=A0A2B4RY83_STYPI|nr:Leucine-rich repeat and WD repeat-containing protein 1 [Stylophora pistillata]